MIKKNALMIQIMFVFFIMFVGLYIPFTQRVPYLTSIGYSNADMNIIFSIQAAIAFIYQLVFGFLCDKYRTIKKFFILSLILGTIGTFFMFQITDNVFYFHILTMAVMGSFINLATGLLDSWALEINPVIQRNYGAVRAMGTIGWIVGGYFVTIIFERFGFSSLGLTYAIISVIVFLLTLRLGDAVKEHHAAPVRIKDLKKLLFSKRYMIIVIVLLFAMMLATSDGILVVMKMEVLKATPFEKYIRFALQAFVELPLFFLGAKLLEKYNPVKLLGFAVFMFGVRYVGYSIAPNPTWMIIVALLQGVTFPILMVASKQLIFRESPPHLRSTGQLFALSIYNGIGASIIPLITTFLINRGGIDFALMALAAMMVIPLTLVFYFLKLEMK